MKEKFEYRTSAASLTRTIWYDLTIPLNKKDKKILRIVEKLFAHGIVSAVLY